jgi:protein-S-isoprenylcysteine O-methyltransferase Ste14
MQPARFASLRSARHRVMHTIGPDRFVIMKLILFATALVFEILYLLMFILTIRLPNFRFWPPPSHRSWQFFVSWIVAGLVAVNFLFVGLLDFDSFFLHHWLRFPISLVLFITSSGVGFWSFSTLGLRATIGLGDELVTDGPYQYSRNPQYLGDCLNIIGYMILTNSWMACVLGILGVILNVLAPFTEEPWLEERFGESYLAYKRKVPQFIRLTKKADAG